MKITLSSLCILLLALAACTGPQREISRPTVVYLPVTHDVVYAGKTVVPSAQEEKNLHQFLSGAVNSPEGSLAFFVAQPFDPISHERVDALKALLFKKGLIIPSQEVLVLQDETVPYDRVRVGSSVTRISAPANCPNWEDGRHSSNYGNTTFPNFGCATAHNFGQALENPNDYLSAQSRTGAGDSTRAAAVLDVYRKPPPDITSGTTGSSSAGGN